MDHGKAIVFEKQRKTVVKNIRFPEIDDATIVVKTKYSGISSGTEMAVYHGEACSDGVCFPCIPGYEQVGEVVYVGKNASKSNGGHLFKAGDRVMANEVRSFPDFFGAWGGQCEFSIKNPVTSPFLSDLAAKIPDNVSYEEAVAAYLACVAKKGVDMVGVNKGETVLVVGMGCVGLSALQLAKVSGAGKIIAADNRDCRLGLPAKYTDYILNISSPNAKDTLLDMNNGQLADVVIECSGNPNAVSPLADFVKPGGRVHLQGQYRQPIVITRYARWNCSDLRISCYIGINPGSKEEVLKLISEKKFDAKSLYSKEYPVDSAPDAYQDLEKNRYEILKTIFKW